VSNATHGTKRCFRFGPFEVDEASRELRKNNERVRLQELPFRVLLLLLERQGGLVSREELHKELWPDGTYVEFEQGLNTAMRKVRQALEDDADKPRFIGTAPRKGYRFLFPLVESAIPPPRSRLPVAIYAGTFLLLLVTVGLAWTVRLRTRPNEPEEDLVRNLERLTADSGLTWQPSISADGKLVAFSSDRGGAGDLDIWVVHVGGGNPIRLTRDPANETEPHFCPDGRIVFQSDRNGGGIYAVPALGGPAVLLAKGGRQPRCSPDGKSVAFWTGSLRKPGNEALFVVPSVGGAPVRVGSAPARARKPLWSSDGRMLLVVGNRQATAPWNETDWWLIPTAPGSARPLGVAAILGRVLGSTAGAPEPADWDARTGDIFFSARRGQADYATWRSDIWSVPVGPASRQSPAPLRHITAATGKHSGASVASDGTLVFADLEVNPNIWTVPVDHRGLKVSGTLQAVVAEKHWESRPALSSDGRTMVYRTEHTGGWDFSMKNLVTGEDKPLTSSGGSKVWAALSRDGARITFHTLQEVYIVETATGSARALCSGCRMRVADWTADGQAVLALNLDSGALELLRASDGQRREILRIKDRPIEMAAFSLTGARSHSLPEDCLWDLLEWMARPTLIPSRLWLMTRRTPSVGHPMARQSISSPTRTDRPACGPRGWTCQATVARSRISMNRGGHCWGRSTFLRTVSILAFTKLPAISGSAKSDVDAQSGLEQGSRPRQEYCCSSAASTR